MLDTAIEVYEKLKDVGITAEVINLRTVKPFDKETVFSSLDKTGFFVSIEDNMKIGGMGEYIYSEYDKPIKSICFGYDEFIPHGRPEELYELYGMSSNKITEKIIKEWQSFAKQA